MVPNPHHITQNLSHSNKDLVYSFARSLKGKHPLCSEQKCTFSHACMHACKYCTFMHVYIIKKHIYIYIHTLTQRPFISLFISIISHNYNSVLSGSSELESKCLVLARSYISHSRTGGGGVRNGGLMNNASCHWRNKDKINPLAQTPSPFSD